MNGNKFLLVLGMGSLAPGLRQRLFVVMIVHVHILHILPFCVGTPPCPLNVNLIIAFMSICCNKVQPSIFVIAGGR